jgi:hypothetical protein
MIYHNVLLGNVAEYRYLWMTITNRNCTYEEIKSRLNLRNICYHSVQNCLYYICYQKVQRLKFTTIILPLILCKGETWPISLSMFENGLLKRISEPKMEEVTGGCRKWHIEEHHLYLHQILLGWSNQGDEIGMTWSLFGKNEKFIQNFVQNIWKEETTSKILAQMREYY